MSHRPSAEEGEPPEDAEPEPEPEPEPQPKRKPKPQPAQHDATPGRKRAHAAVGRAVSLGFLGRFVAEHRGMARSWAVAREFLAAEDGGGGSAEVVVTH
eukprot:COSAG06_NODE_34506_length_473_cov_1.893048_1_plen_98_part_01